MENLFKDLPNVTVYIDDILITGEMDEEHLKTLQEVLCHLERVGLKARKSKCRFMASSVAYLGDKIDAEGLHPMTEKVKAIVEAPDPTNVHELKSYLGLLTYYSKFLRNMSTVLAPLNALLRKGNQWHWTAKEKKGLPGFQGSPDLIKVAGSLQPRPTSLVGM
jgi:hypothetical protein